LAGLKALFVVTVLQVFLPQDLFAQSLPFSQGPWMKVGVQSSGIYRVDYSMLKIAGLDPDNLDPALIQVFAFPAGMLPQSNNPSLQWQYKELSVQIGGGADGQFDKQDAIFFYGQGPDKIGYDEDKALFTYENNLYSDYSYYLITAGGAPGKRIPKQQNTPGAASTITEYVDYGLYERDLYNDQKSGRQWFGEIMDVKPDLTIRFDINGIVANSNIKVVSSLMSQSYSPSSFKTYWNNNLMLDKSMPVIPETQYGSKGSVEVDTVVINSNAAGASSTSTQDIKITFAKGATGRSVGFLDYVLLNVTRKLAWYGGQTPFTIPASSQAVSDIEMSGVPTDAIVWDVTNPFDVREMSPTLNASTLRFGTQTDATKNYVAFQQTQSRVTPLVRSVATPHLFLSTVPNLLIVTHGAFEAEARRLANHRTKEYGIDVAVIRVDAIYDTYSGGRQDISAIRNYIRDLYNRAPDRLSNVLLFGKGSYDYKDRVVNNSNYVPTYESYNSLSPLETFSSDDYFGLLEDHEGTWGESPAENSTLEIGIGRIPVRTAQEAQSVVDKLIAYDTDKERFAGWRKDILFVADDGDWNIHQADAEELAEDIENTYHKFHTNKIFLDAFKQEQRASGQYSPDASAALTRELNKGYAIVNYTGHGNEYVWMDERILDQDTPTRLTNNPRLPLYVTATCEFGRNDNPLLISTAEQLLTKKKGGAIALVTATRPVFSTTNFSLNKAFYAALFKSAPGGKDLGTLFKETKNNSISGISNRNFSLLGDPSMRFGPAPETFVVTKLQTNTGSSVLNALSEVIIEGEIRNGTAVSDFDGVVEVTLHGKRSNLVTKGDENEPFSYKNWEHALFRGKATVANGLFAMSFRLPANIDATVADGKLSLYAFSNDHKREVLGTVTNVKVGGPPASPGQDTSGPLSELFLGDTTFVSGGIANNNTTFIAKLSDASGINISGYDPYGLTAQLDDGTPFAVNDYYVGDIDDPTRGKVEYPLTGLVEGLHRITLIAYDNLNNKSTSAIDFSVGADGQLVVEEFISYPNPFTEADPVSFQFTHSRAGDDLEAQVFIYNSMGQLAEQLSYFVPSSGYTVTLGSWNGLSSFGSKMGTGIYLAKLSVRSMSDGAKNAKITKLILVN
jgi:hypothetical protein